MLGLIAGGGELPRLIVEGCQRQQRELFVIGIESAADAALVEAQPHHWMRLGAVGKTLSAMKAAGVTELVLAGRVRRPKLSAIIPDITGAKLLARLTRLIRSGDDAVLSEVLSFLEEQGFSICGVDDILHDIVAPAGVMTRLKPDTQSVKDSDVGCEALRHLGVLDVGQALIVQRGRIIGIEAAEGTDGLLQRIGPYLHEGEGGVLVKCKKPKQDRRVDLPTIGTDTVEHAAAAGLAGIVVEAGNTLVINREAVIAAADAHKLFITGVAIGEQA